jgi:hypothetical protein
MFENYNSLINQLTTQESILAQWIIGAKEQTAALYEVHKKLMLVDPKLANHLNPKQSVFRILDRMMNDTLIMINNDTIKAFLQRQNNK